MEEIKVKMPSPAEYAVRGAMAGMASSVVVDLLFGIDFKEIGKNIKGKLNKDTFTSAYKTAKESISKENIKTAYNNVKETLKNTNYKTLVKDNFKKGVQMIKDNYKNAAKTALNALKTGTKAFGALALAALPFALIGAVVGWHTSKQASEEAVLNLLDAAMTAKAPEQEA